MFKHYRSKKDLNKHKTVMEEINTLKRIHNKKLYPNQMHLLFPKRG